MTTNHSEDTNKRSPMYEMSRRLMLAGIGAASLAESEINAFVDRLVERGEVAEGDARKLVREVMDRREKLEQEREAQRSKGKTGTATKADIDTLTSRIAELTRQIEELKKSQTPPQA